MNLSLDDTIAALASAPGPGGRGIVRVAGPNVREILSPLLDVQNDERWHTLRHAACHQALFRIPQCPSPLPTAVYLWPGSRSYTGQPLAELHTIGSPPLLEAVLSTIYEQGVRPARPGEFTLRAFLAGRIDLMQAEAVLGVIDAYDHQELETALSQLAGGISGTMALVREDLLGLLADLEAGLDFVEEPIEFVQHAELIDRLKQACQQISQLLDQAKTRLQSKGRPRVVLAGLPNAGKSTLFNILAGHEAALVSKHQGTTRDYLCAEVDWQQTQLELFDTAGWELETDPLTHRSQDFRHQQFERADLIVWCRAADFDVCQRTTDQSRFNQLKTNNRPVMEIEIKSDLSPGSQHSTDIRVSAHTGDGIEELKRQISSLLASATPGSRQLLGSTAARCRESLATAHAALARALQCAENNDGEEIVVIELRDALEHLGQILGTVYTDDILDRIFSKFCIGK